MKQKTCLLLTMTLLLGGCSQRGEPTGKGPGLHTTVVTYTGEDDDAQYLEIAQRSQKLLALLEEKAGAFVMDAYNYQAVDDEGTPLYTLNTLRYPEEIAPNGRTLNLLVPEQLRDLEPRITAAHRKRFYFEKVTAENDYNDLAGRPERLDLTEEDLTAHIIYVREGRRYFTYRSDCAAETENWIEDPVVQIYTGNIHCNYAHSFLSQWCYFPSEGETAADAYELIRPWVEECGAGESIKKVERTWKG